MDTNLLLEEGPGTNMDGPTGTTTPSECYQTPVVQMPNGSVLFTTATEDDEDMMQWSRAETPDPGDPGCAD
eukprot:925965-Karenia_brevis.AAC.1